MIMPRPKRSLKFDEALSTAQIENTNPQTSYRLRKDLLVHEESQLNSYDPKKFNVLKKRIFAGEKDTKISKSPLLSVSKNSSQLMEGFNAINKHALSPMLGLRPLEPSQNQTYPN